MLLLPMLLNADEVIDALVDSLGIVGWCSCLGGHGCCKNVQVMGDMRIWIDVVIFLAEKGCRASRLERPSTHRRG